MQRVCGGGDLGGSGRWHGGLVAGGKPGPTAGPWPVLAATCSPGSSVPLGPGPTTPCPHDPPRDYSDFLVARGERPLAVRRCGTVEELLAQSDVVSLHCVLDARWEVAAEESAGRCCHARRPAAAVGSGYAAMTVGSLCGSQHARRGLLPLCTKSPAQMSMQHHAPDQQAAAGGDEAGCGANQRGARPGCAPLPPQLARCCRPAPGAGSLLPPRPQAAFRSWTDPSPVAFAQ